MWSSQVNTVNDKMVAFFEERLAKMGALDGGLYHYYKDMARRKKIIKDEDAYLIEYINSNFDKGTRIHEIACGAAQLGNALSLLEFKVIATEIDRRRYELALALKKHMRSRCRILNENSFEAKIDADLVVTRNAVASTVDISKSVDWFKKMLNRGAAVIINPGLYGGQDRDRVIDAINGIEFKELKYGFIRMDALPLKELPEKYREEYDSISQNEWTSKKTNRSRMVRELFAYVNRFIPEIKRGGLNVLDVGGGSGELIEIAQYYGNTGLNVMLPFPPDGNWGEEYMFYERHAEIQNIRQGNSFMRLDFYKTILDGRFPVNDYYDVINCRHAINLIMIKHFKVKQNPYSGRWEINVELREVWMKMLELLGSIMTPGGIFMISALNSENIGEYSEFVYETGEDCSFEVEDYGPTNHKMRKI